MFTIGCMLMTPLAYLKCLFQKIYLLFDVNTDNKNEVICRIFEVIFYFFFGLSLQTLNILSDSVYFFLFNTDDNLQTNEVIKDKSQMTFESFRDILYMC